jgi:hypothetical protein
VLFWAAGEAGGADDEGGVLAAGEAVGAADAGGVLAAGDADGELPDEVKHETDIGNPPSVILCFVAPGLNFPSMSYSQQLLPQDDDPSTHGTMHDMVSEKQLPKKPCDRSA